MGLESTPSLEGLPSRPKGQFRGGAAEGGPLPLVPLKGGFQAAQEARLQSGPNLIHLLFSCGSIDISAELLIAPAASWPCMWIAMAHIDPDPDPQTDGPARPLSGPVTILGLGLTLVAFTRPG